MDDIKSVIKILENLEKRIIKIEQILSKPQSVAKESITTEKRKSNKKKSVGGVIMELREDKFFDTPKAFGEIVEELKRRGYYYERTSLTLPLQTLLRKKSLGRISVSGQWAYVKR